METEQRRAAKEQMIALMQAGHRWQEAAAQAGIQFSRLTAYWLLRQVRSRGKAADPGMADMGTLRNCEQTAGMDGTLLPYVARHAKPCGVVGTVRHPEKLRLSQPGLCRLSLGSTLIRPRLRH
jgi:hypothetical protein